MSDYRKYINKFLAKSKNTLDVDVLKMEILDFFSDIPNVDSSLNSSELNRLAAFAVGPF